MDVGLFETDLGFGQAIATLFNALPAATLRARHKEPWRHYHDWSHPTAMKDDLVAAERDGVVVRDGAAALAFVLWHDAIYDPQAARGRNEALSAALCREEFSAIAAPISVSRACEAILATIGHAPPDPEASPDAALLLDVDLGILGADADRFDRYDAGIRREYAHVPEDVYRRERRRILGGFLERPRLYATDWAHARWDAAARGNLARAVDALAPGA